MREYRCHLHKRATPQLTDIGVLHIRRQSDGPARTCTAFDNERGVGIPMKSPDKQKSPVGPSRSCRATIKQAIHTIINTHARDTIGIDTIAINNAVQELSRKLAQRLARVEGEARRDT